MGETVSRPPSRMARPSAPRTVPGGRPGRAGSGGPSEAKGRVRLRAPQGHDPARVQILRLRHDTAVRAGHHLCRRPQRLGQVQRRGRAVLGHGRAGGQVAARRQDGGRHLRRDDRAPAARPRRGLPHDRQLRRRSADRVRRGHHHADHVPQRRQRVPDQRRHLPAARHPGAALRLRHRPRDARHRRPGPARLRPARRPHGAAGVHRGGRRRPQAPQAQGEGAAEAGRDAGQSRPRPGPDRRTAAAAQAPRTAGRGRPPRRSHPGGPARRPAAAARRRSRTAQAGAEHRGRRRGRAEGTQGGGRGRTQGRARPGGRSRGRGTAARAAAPAGTAELVRTLPARRARPRHRLAGRRPGQERDRAARGGPARPRSRGHGA